MADLRRILIEDTDWQAMHEQGYEAISANELVHGYVLCLGAMRHAPVSAALHLQAMLAEHLDHFAVLTRLRQSKPTMQCMQRPLLTFPGLPEQMWKREWLS
ncbi:hypothetical protein FTO74_10620 [Granulicella sp. WH15]|uniref:hypothetical protein n=1 Tax=Granulicella sp. WH15 TaxID=2602070 RepID=UPI00136720AC|nr:hypothetical protein [Granulicella sp. WH15]QHN03775.1 hypothetical protein FTO74_10620 [Granulicella sp. WH15]